MNDRRGVQKISFVAHSLGGLIARYAIGRLYEAGGVGNHSDKGKGHEGRIAGLEPMNFITFATPHLGSKGNKQVMLMFGLIELGPHYLIVWIFFVLHLLNAIVRWYILLNDSQIMMISFFFVWGTGTNGSICKLASMVGLCLDIIFSHFIHFSYQIASTLADTMKLISELI